MNVYEKRLYVYSLYTQPSVVTLIFNINYQNMPVAMTTWVWLTCFQWRLSILTGPVGAIPTPNKEMQIWSTF